MNKTDLGLLLAAAQGYVLSNPEVLCMASNDVKRAFGVLPPRQLARKHYNKPLQGLTDEEKERNKEIDRKRAEKKTRKAKGRNEK